MNESTLIKFCTIRMEVYMLSIIIPAYNCELTIERCIKSFIEDNIEKEVIIVNDGSTDNTKTVLSNLTKKYDAVKVINQKNSGAAIARNMGLQVAIGDYYGFLDADDFVDENYFSELYKFAKVHDVDMVMGNVNREEKTAYIPFKHKSILNREEIMNKAIPLQIAPFHEYDYDKVIPCAMWAYIFRNKLIQENNIQFYNVKNGQDSLFTLECSCCSLTMGIVNNVFYHYENIDNSLSKQYTVDRYLRLIKSSEYMKMILEKYKITPYPAYQMEQLDRHHVYFAIRQILHQSIDRKEKKKFMIDIFNNPVSIKAFSCVRWNDLSFQMKILYFLLKYKCIRLLSFVISMKDSLV